MRQAIRLSGRIAVVLALLVGTAALCFAADPPKAPAGAPAMSPEQQKMMDNMMKAMQPGENHKRLASFAGSWTTHVKVWMMPGQPPAESDGTMEAKWVMGGRYMMSNFTGSFMGQPFEGQATDGYDNLTGKYVSTWIDNQGTGMLNTSGTCDAGCKVLTETGEMMDPMTNKKTTYKSVVTFVDDNTFKYEAFSVSGGKSMKAMEMICHRKA
jgi:hypothetical protein